VGICTSHSVHPSAIAHRVKSKGGGKTHGADANLLADRISLVDVGLVELHARELGLEPLENGADDFAGPAPRCPEIEYGVLVLVNLQRDASCSSAPHFASFRGKKRKKTYNLLEFVNVADCLDHDGKFECYEDVGKV
jgi:hypothetical protein